jgi:hypothetical protein
MIRTGIYHLFPLLTNGVGEDFAAPAHGRFWPIAAQGVQRTMSATGQSRPTTTKSDFVYFVFTQPGPTTDSRQGGGTLVAKLELAGSEMPTNTIGIVCVSRWSAAVTGVEFARITSGCLAAAQRTSIRRLLPSVQPTPQVPASTRRPSGDHFRPDTSAHRPRRMRLDCWPRTASGHATAYPSPAMNSRRRIRDLPG